jgi:hypothetical protein
MLQRCFRDVHAVTQHFATRSNYETIASCSASIRTPII